MSRPDLMIGQILGGRYRIDELLGQGGMSAVFKAYDPNLKRVVAVKMIHSHLASDPKFMSRFEEEAAAVAQLRHPHIVQVFDFNHDDDLYYMVQEFLPGETLQDHLRRLHRSGRQLALGQAIAFTSHIAQAAGYAHKRGLVHRDIKPANIMLDVNNQAILMDFGIVKIVGSDRHTATGAVVGTALYLPPELIRGETPDARSDEYSLGVTLFEMVSGKPPFEADSAMTLMMMHLNDPLPDLRSLRPETPEALAGAIQKSLEKDRSRRYASMEEFEAALAAALPTAQDAPPAVLAAATIVDAPDDSAQAASATLVAAAVAGAAPAGAAAVPVMTPPATGTTPPVVAAVPPSSPPPTSGTGAVATGASGRRPPLLLIGGGALLVLVLIIGGVIWAMAGRSGGENAAASPPAQTAPAVAVLPATETAQPALPTVSAAPPTETATLEPSPTPTQGTPTLPPSPTVPPGIHFVRINGISADASSHYVVDYETFEYTEKLPGEHVHFFFDSVPLDQAGKPGKGPWYLYGGPRPFTKFILADRPDTSGMMCALVANANHSVQPDSGNCIPLPDVPVAIALQDMPCLAGVTPGSAVVSQLETWQARLVLGISPDESWWNVAIPGQKGESCWLERSTTLFQGDISTLPLVEPPQATALAIQITGITLDAQNQYVVEYQTQGYSEQLPGTHIHFFFNTFTADQVGSTGGGNRRMYGGPTPFTGYGAADRPQDATQLCALVANPDHTVIPDSGNCVDLP